MSVQNTTPQCSRQLPNGPIHRCPPHILLKPIGFFYFFAQKSTRLLHDFRTSVVAQKQPLRLAHEWAAQEVRITENIQMGFMRRPGKDYSLNRDTETTVHILWGFSCLSLLFYQHSQTSLSHVHNTEQIHTCTHTKSLGTA